MPSADAQRPGLVIRDPYHYSDRTLLIPPQLVQCLDCFDGVQTETELRAELVRITGQIYIENEMRQLTGALDEAGFLENDTYRTLKLQRQQAFAREETRTAIFAGNAYPDDAAELNDLLLEKVGSVNAEPRNQPRIVAIAAPHASPEAGWPTYRAAYQSLPSKQEADDITFVILGTSHYGAPDYFGMTRKSFGTPFGFTRTNKGLIDELARRAPEAIRMEDYCHSVEHSIEFQVIFLQHLYGADVKILPILCGPFIKSVYEGGMPEDQPRLSAFFDSLGDIVAREGRRLFFVLGVDMAHIGQRYGDPYSARADQGAMLEVKDRDHSRIQSLNAGKADDYWSQVQEKQDDLKWCGSAPFYTFLKVMPQVKGELLDYHQWQIDPHSVVSFGAMRFSPVVSLRS